MSTIIEDPDIPLVGLNNRHYHSYTEEHRRFSDAPSSSSSSSPCPPDTSQTTDDPKDNGFDTNVGYRLARRKFLLRQRRLLADLSLFFAALGVVLMALHIELCVNFVYASPQNLISELVRFSITLSTLILLAVVAGYHILDVRIFMCDNSLDDWRLAMSGRRIARIAVELIICAVHPLPGAQDGATSGSYQASDDRGVLPPGTMVNDAGTDVYLSIPMFLRVFLVARVVLLHSRLYTNASSQSLGALNRVHFNATFIFRSLMKIYPEYLLTALMFSVFLTASWTLHACEDELGMLNSMWVIAITFLTIGYGDIVPRSYCGRGVSVIAGMFGAGCTALVVAVLAQRLELTRGEKFVHNFVLDVELDRRYRVAAANIVKAGWQVYKFKNHLAGAGGGAEGGPLSVLGERCSGGRSGRVRHYQRKLLRAIHEIREVKQEKRRVDESSVSVVELFKSQNVMSSAVQRLKLQQDEMIAEVINSRERLERIERRLDQLIAHLVHREAGL